MCQLFEEVLLQNGKIGLLFPTGPELCLGREKPLDSTHPINLFHIQVYSLILKWQQEVRQALSPDQSSRRSVNALGLLSHTYTVDFVILF